jgi:hypothetical protein
VAEDHPLRRPLALDPDASFPRLRRFDADPRLVDATLRRIVDEARHRKAGARGFAVPIWAAAGRSRRSRSWWSAGVRGVRAVLGDETLALLLGSRAAPCSSR